MSGAVINLEMTVVKLSIIWGGFMSAINFPQGCIQLSTITFEMLT